MPLCQTISVQGQLHSQYPFGPGALVDMETGNWDSSRCGTWNSSFICFCACAMTGCGSLSCVVIIECKSSKGMLWRQAECWEVLIASDGNWMWRGAALPLHLQIQKYSAGYLIKVFSCPKNIVNKWNKSNFWKLISFLPLQMYFIFLALVSKPELWNEAQWS